MVDTKTTTNAHYNINYHLVWIPKYRRSVINDELKIRLEKIFKEIAEEKGLTILAMEIMPDHIHLFVSSPPQHSPALLVNWFKGISARKNNYYFKIPRLKWAHGYYAGTAGSVTVETIKRYIAEQRAKPEED